MSPHRTYETVVGYFSQDDPKPAAGWLDLPPRFGLIDGSPESWYKFIASIQQLNIEAPSHVQYKVFFLGRHGEGYHNVAEAKYGKKAWDDYWSKLNGDGELTWGPDPDLTSRGEGQADQANEAWKTEVLHGLPFPEKLYCSPLTRTIRTSQRTFKDITVDGRKTTIVENIREIIGVHTCDKRRTRTYINQTFPEYSIEDGFAEEDELWRPDVRETLADVDVRVKAALDMIFENDKEQFISITTHGGFFGSFLRVTNHQLVYLPTGGVMPTVVKATAE
ncbi:histidine phosphatase superfamily [Pisolithus orientalis]|uniref:histidine phosphatase superfamily n=1 Tax=Pisolithus orientalis TaxID=936130 RepID=UPI002224DA11|nr:histidine phosphatase superfamily [Pisolithus orientalis]KAI6003272.1 histidine phosphatase superfamily [Pisolithus orientalis]